MSISSTEHGPEVRGHLEGMNTKRLGVMTCLCDLLDAIYLHCLMKGEEAWKVEVMVLREDKESVRVGVKLWKKNRFSNFNFQERRITQNI